MNAKKVVVAMSGGVDSSVAAALLKRQGLDVTGVMLRLWSEPGSEAANRCCTPDAMAQARKVAAMLEIPFYTLDARELFHKNVVEPFMDGYARGVTPNPCAQCNRTIRWGLLWNAARSMGAEYFATGHYARVYEAGGRYHLAKAVDEGKDQSYILSVLTQEQLASTCFPVGEFHKSEVREMARQFGLPVAERPDSQDLCFLAGQDYREFLRRWVPGVNEPGPIVDRRGNVLGRHEGLAAYTIGQRKGLGVPSLQPLYVLDKDIEQNTLVVGTAQELGRTQLKADQVHWTGGQGPEGAQKVEAKIRYRAPLVGATLVPLGDESVMLAFERPLRDITPGQLVVFYQGEEVVGSGIIAYEPASDRRRAREAADRQVGV
jgi:tRNA-specific 2-thiouridylase